MKKSFMLLHEKKMNKIPIVPIKMEPRFSERVPSEHRKQKKQIILKTNK